MNSIQYYEEAEYRYSNDYVTEAYAADVASMANEGAYAEADALEDWFAANFAGATGLVAAYTLDDYEAA